MIQRMNNVLIKHSKVLFGIITIVIIISFVWFLTPGADGSLLFSKDSNVVAKLGDDEVKVSDVKDVYKTMLLMQAPEAYEKLGKEKAAEYLRRINANDDELIQLAVLLKLAHQQGFSASDNEVLEILKKMPLFQENNAFSSAKYDLFIKELVEPLGYNVEDFENAIRTALMLDKFQASAMAGVVPPTQNEVEMDVKSILYKISGREISFSVAQFVKDIKEPTEEEIKQEYDKDPTRFKAPPVSSVQVAFINHKDITIPDLEQRVDAQFKSTGASKLDAAGKPLPEADAKKIIRTEILAEEARQLLSAVVSEAGETPTRESLTAAAAKKNVKLQFAEANDISPDTAPSALFSQDLINAICMIQNVNEMSPIVNNKDSAAVAILTARTEAKQLDFEAAKVQVKAMMVMAAAEAKAKEAADALRAEIANGKVTIATLPDAVAKAGAVLTDEEVTNVPEAITSGFGPMADMFTSMNATNNMQMLSFMVAQYQRLSSMVEPKVGTMTDAQIDPYAGVCTFAIVTNVEKVESNEMLIKLHTEYLFALKKIEALTAWRAWVNKEIETAILAVRNGAQQ